MQTGSVVLVTAAELQVGGPAVPVRGLQSRTITKALLRHCVECHLLWRGPASCLWAASAAEPSASPAHTVPPCMQKWPTFGHYFYSCLCRAPFLAPFLPHQSRWAAQRS